MNHSRRHVVIMAGGRGERFWPQSRRGRPKHFLPIVGAVPLLAQTVGRLRGVVPPENIWVITNAEQCAAVREMCPEVPCEQIVGEPCGRDTAAVVMLAALLVDMKTPGGTLAMLPADAVIRDEAQFRQTLLAGFAVAEAAGARRLVTIGIRPTAPATGYGYMRIGARQGDGAGAAVFAVQRFVEKPDAERAVRYLESGEYLWNAGMFVWTCDAIGDAFARHEPEVWRAVSQLRARLAGGESLGDALSAIWAGVKKISVDYAVLEKADNVVCIPADFGWDDVGEWTALARHEAADAAGNVCRGETAVLDASRNIIVAEPGHLVAVVGVEDLVIVHTPDATLVCPKGRVQEIKKLVGKVPARFVE